MDEEFFTLSGVLLDDLSETLPADDVMIVCLFDFLSVTVLIFSVGSYGEGCDFVAVRCFLYFRIRGHVSDDGGLIEHGGYYLKYREVRRTRLYTSERRRTPRMILFFKSTVVSTIAWENWTRQNNAMSPGAKMAQM